MAARVPRLLPPLGHVPHPCNRHPRGGATLQNTSVHPRVQAAHAPACGQERERDRGDDGGAAEAAAASVGGDATRRGSAASGLGAAALSGTAAVGALRATAGTDVVDDDASSSGDGGGVSAVLSVTAGAFVSRHEPRRAPHTPPGTGRSPGSTGLGVPLSAAQSLGPSLGPRHDSLGGGANARSRPGGHVAVARGAMPGQAPLRPATSIGEDSVHVAARMQRRWTLAGAAFSGAPGPGHFVPPLPSDRRRRRTEAASCCSLAAVPAVLVVPALVVVCGAVCTAAVLLAPPAAAAALVFFVFVALATV